MPEPKIIPLYLRQQVAKLSRGHDLAKAIQYMLKRWPAFTLFLEDGRVCMSTDGVEKGDSQPGAAAVARALDGFSFHAATIRS
jgi:hypothetical protein